MCSFALQDSILLIIHIFFYSKVDGIVKLLMVCVKIIMSILKAY